MPTPRGRLTGEGVTPVLSGVMGRVVHGGCGARVTARGFPECRAELRLHSRTPLGKLLVPVQGRPGAGRAKSTAAAEPGPGGCAGSARGRCVPGRGAPPPSWVKRRPARAEQGEGAAAASSLLPRTILLASSQGEGRAGREGRRFPFIARSPEGRAAGGRRDRGHLPGAPGPRRSWGSPVGCSRVQPSCVNQQYLFFNIKLPYPCMQCLPLTIVLNFSLRRGL